MSKELNRRAVWVRCGGRCFICNRYLLDDGLVGLEVPLGEVAHIVGQGTGPKTPRGGLLDSSEIDDPDNLVLVCASEHDAIDHSRLTTLMSVDVLGDLKRAQEARIRHLTSLAHDNRTAVIRMVGNLRGSAVEISREQVAAATLRHSRFPDYQIEPDRQGLEIDLRQTAGEEAGSRDYYIAATARVDEMLRQRFRPAVEAGVIGAHVSVFAFARIPLLVHLGAQLDDTLDADIYDKHRDSGWAWPVDEQTVAFSLEVAREGDRDDRVVLKLDVSGTIAIDELPDDVADCTIYRIAPEGRAGEKNIIRSTNDLSSFAAAVNSVIAALEADHKHATGVAVFAAAPISAAVTLGRSFARGLHPPLTIYDRPPDGIGFVEALTTNSRHQEPVS